MSELTRDIMLDAVKDLVAAFPSKKRSDDEQRRLAMVYFESMRDQQAEAIRFAVRQAIREERYFPAVSTLLTHCAKWREIERKRVGDANQPSLLDAVDSGSCPNCKERYNSVTRWRPAVGEAYHWLVSADGVWLLLESFKRDACACSSRSLYQPSHRVEPAAMLASSVTLLMPTKRVPVHMREAEVA